MAGYIESEAVFKQRCLEIGMTPAHVAALTAASYQTMGRYAYSCSFVPGAADDTALITMITAVNGGAQNQGVVALFRRLFFESFTSVQADLKLKLERTEDTPARRLAVPERSARYEAQQLKLAGLVLRGELECADGLIDEAISQFDENRLKFIRWERCIKKEAELDNVKKDSAILPNAQGFLKATSIDNSPEADTSTELLLRFALTRRGLAYDQANLLEYANHEMWVTKLFTNRLREAPPDHQRVTLAQLLAADKALFVRLAEQTRAGIVPNHAGQRPLDLVFAATMCEQEIVQLMMPSMSSSSSTKRAGKGSEPWEVPVKKQRKGGKGKGKGKEKGKSKGPPSLPSGLEGESRTPEGSHICFSYNFGKCTSGKGGCTRGKHVCTKCFQSHPFIEHGSG